MAVLIKKGFDMKYEVHEIGSVKVVQSGEFQGNKYNSSVQFKAINVEQNIDPDLGIVDKEYIFSFKVYCKDEDLKQFNSWLRSLDTKTKPLVLTGTLPISQGKDTFSVTSYLNANDIMTLNGAVKTTK
ncbi:MAG: hypothetical protein PHE73_03765 [Sulfurovaceae bacterium]|nr:hypothetical protein [Sulfurovaceae bacterium]